MDSFTLFKCFLIINILTSWNSKYCDGKSFSFAENMGEYIFTSDVLNETYLPEIGNGHIATQIMNEYMFMNGIYNGNGRQSHRARIPSSINWNVSSKDEVVKHLYSLDSVRGIFKEVLVYPEYNISLSSFVSRVDRQNLVRNISLESNKSSTNVTLTSQGSLFSSQSPDFDFYIQELPQAYKVKGITKIPENNHTEKLPIFIFIEKVPKEMTLNNTIPWMAFITTIDTEERMSFEAFNKALSHKSQLMCAHVRGWMESWDDGFILVHSALPHVASSILAAQYYLLSSLPNKRWVLDDPSWTFFGLSPTGLAHGDTLDDYMGHVFWDMDTWMFPVIFPFHNSLALELIKYRGAMLESAILSSKLSGFKGARYPWESARTGFETTFDPIVGKNEIHISADVSFAVQQLLWMNSKMDSTLYYSLGKSIILNVARFWASRTIYNERKGTYEIMNVMPPDEYVEYANNSAFTNAAAINSLKAPLVTAKRYQDNITSEMTLLFQIAERISIPYDKNLNLILEHDGYKMGTKVKQADVVLLHFPLNFQINEQCFRNNLNYYGQVTDINGPAMTWAIFSINWLSLNDSEKGENYFKKNFQYITFPFYVWTEEINGGGAKNFLTGIGGYLQNILYGFMGMRLQFEDDGQLVLDPIMTRSISDVTLHNVTFQDSNLDVVANETNISIKLLNAESIEVFATKSERKYLLTFPNEEVRIERQRVIVRAAGRPH